MRMVPTYAQVRSMLGVRCYYCLLGVVCVDEWHVMMVDVGVGGCSWCGCVVAIVCVCVLDVCVV